MPIQICEKLTAADERMVREAVDGFVPDEVFDIHAHLFHSRAFRGGKPPQFLKPDTGYGLKEFRDALGRWLPGRKLKVSSLAIPRQATIAWAKMPGSPRSSPRIQRCR